MIDFRAYGENIIVLPHTEPDVTPVGLYVVEDEYSKKIMYADVLSVGSEVKNGVTEGDVVVFDYWAGASYKDYVILPSEVVLAVVSADGD